MFHVLGIDAGGTKTVCLLADEHGTIVAESRRGGANLQAVGELEVEKVLHEVMEEAIGDRDVRPASICLGIAGVDRRDDAAVVQAIMKRIGYKARVLVVNDALVALEAGAPGQPAVVVISGTGSIAYGRNASGEAARSGGWGYVLGDEGSGYWIGRAALRAVLRQSDRRGPDTVLSTLLLEHFGIQRAQELIHEVYHANLRPSAIGALAQCVQSAFTQGDGVAIGILRGRRRRARRLRAVRGTPPRHGRPVVSRTSSPAASSGPCPGSRQELERRLPVASPQGRVRLLDREPAAGAVALALQEAGGGAVIPAYKLD